MIPRTIHLHRPPRSAPHPPQCPQQALPARSSRRPAGDRGTSAAAGQPRLRPRPLGSMCGEKIASRRAPCAEAIATLQPDDRFSVVVYDDVVEVVVESTTASDEARRNAIDRLRDHRRPRQHQPGEGWLRGCEQVAEPPADRGVNRCLLLTDGLANVGITDPSQLAHPRRRAARPRRVDDHVRRRQRLRRAPAPGAGRRRRRPLLLHRGRAADPRRDHVARWARRSRSWRATSRSRSRRATASGSSRSARTRPSTRGNRTVVSLGDLASEQVVEVVLRLSFPYGDLGREIGAIVNLTDRDGVFAAGGASHADPVRLTWTYADDRANDDQPRDREVDRAVARQFAARARQEAVQRNRTGDFVDARRALASTAKRIRGYAGSDAEMRSLIDALEGDAPLFSAPMAEQSRKQAHFASANLLRSRDASGRSVRRS